MPSWARTLRCEPARWTVEITSEYRALFDRTKTRFDAFVAQGKVLSNFATVLELLLRLRQACDHPFLTMSHSDTSKLLDVDRLVGRFLKGSAAAEGGITTAFASNVAKEIKNGILTLTLTLTLP